MRKGKLLFFCLCAGLVLTVVFWVLSPDREPKPAYKGLTLSEWTDLLPGDGASNAIRHMGTNTFPVILKWLHSGPAPWRNKMLRRLSVLPDWSRPDFLENWLSNEQADFRVVRADQVLMVLQEEAAPIAPELLRLSYDKSDFVSNRALAALGYYNMPKLSAAEEAIRAIGTNGLPWMLERIRYHRSWARDVATRWTARFRPAPPQYWTPEGVREQQMIDAGVDGIFVLGPDASSAAPALTEILEESVTPQIGTRARFCLWLVQPPARVLVQRLSYRKAGVVKAAARGLGRNVAEQPSVSVAALGKVLELNKDPSVRCTVADVLVEFGQNARIVLPALKNALDDPNEDVRRTVTNAVLKIAPEALEKTKRETENVRLKQTE